MYHEKHRAWVIFRDFATVNLTGGSNFEAQWYKSELELLTAIDEAIDAGTRKAKD